MKASHKEIFFIKQSERDKGNWGNEFIKMSKYSEKCSSRCYHGDVIKYKYLSIRACTHMMMTMYERMNYVNVLLVHASL